MRTFGPSDEALLTADGVGFREVDMRNEIPEREILAYELQVSR